MYMESIKICPLCKSDLSVIMDRYKLCTEHYSGQIIHNYNIQYKWNKKYDYFYVENLELYHLEQHEKGQLLISYCIIDNYEKECKIFLKGKEIKLDHRIEIDENIVNKINTYRMLF